jgi:hypothetical protein
MNLLVVSLAINIRFFREVGGSNSKIGSNGKLGDTEDLEKESWKEPKKD